VILTPEQTEFADRWDRIEPELRRALSINPFGLVYQVVIRAVPVAASGEPISLLAMSGGNVVRSTTFIESAKAAVRPYLSHDLRLRLLDQMRKIGINI
jgi:hypothetical protein